MASFGWKRRIGEKVSRATSRQFEADAADDRGLAGEEDDEGWVLAAKRRKEGLVGGCVEKSRRLKDEGASLAENRRYQCNLSPSSQVLDGILIPFLNTRQLAILLRSFSYLRNTAVILFLFRSAICTE